MIDDAAWMRLAIREAAKGQGRTSPNPCVGAVVVRDDLLVGKGYHQRAGTPHAEVHALREAGEAARGATLYVTLEPCNHTGRTPPCTQAILASGIKRVVVGMRDPNPIASGGCEFLSGQGVEVSHGLLAEQCLQLNRPFVKRVTTGRPWVIMKAGMSLDGRIATVTGHSGWITGEQSRARVHRLRDQVDAILVGSGTAMADDPSLTTRLPGGRKGRDPLRIILDSTLRLPPTAKLLGQDSPAATWLFCGPDVDPARAEALVAAGAVLKPVAVGKDGLLDLGAVLCTLGEAGMNSVLVEGGSQVHGAFLRAGLVDEVNLFVAPAFIGGDGLPLLDVLGVRRVEEAPRLTITATRRFGGDLLIEGIFSEPPVAAG